MIGASSVNGKKCGSLVVAQLVGRLRGGDLGSCHQHMAVNIFSECNGRHSAGPVS